jgi:hypothetical protein
LGDGREPLLGANGKYEEDGRVERTERDSEKQKANSPSDAFGFLPLGGMVSCSLAVGWWGGV